MDDASPHLVEIARTVAPILSRPGHEVTATPVARAEIARRRARGKATLAIERPGEFTYICKEHPWAKAQIVVTP